MAVDTTDPCLMSEMGKEFATGKIGLWNLRSSNYSTSNPGGTLAANTGLKKDATGYAYADPVGGVLYAGATITAGFSSGASYAPPAPVGGSTASAVCTVGSALNLTNTLTRNVYAYFNFEWSMYATVGQGNGWLVGPVFNAGVGPTQPAPGWTNTGALEQVAARSLVTGNNSAGGARHFRSALYTITPGAQLSVYATIHSTNDGGTQTASVYNTLLVNYGVLTIWGWPLPPV